MHPAPFVYHRAASLQEASGLLAELGEDAKALAGGQSLIPLLKLRLADPAHIVDLSFIRGHSYIHADESRLRMGALAKHAAIERCDWAQRIPILKDCAAGIGDVQVRSRGTLGGSLAEADPSGDWWPVLRTLEAQVVTISGAETKTVPLEDFIPFAYETSLDAGELIAEVTIPVPAVRTGGAYIAFKRAAQVYATASAAVVVRMEDDGHCRRARIALGSAGLSPLDLSEAESLLSGQPVDEAAIEKAAQAAADIAEPLEDYRGSAAYKRALIGALVSRAAKRALRRARGESIEGGHEYV